MADLPYLGEITIVAFNFAPRGWAFCNGQLLSIQQNQALFSILGTTYGGNGQSTFALPNFQGRVPVHTGNGIQLGQVGGLENVTLLSSHLPQHVHPISNVVAKAKTSPDPASTTDPTNNYFAENTAETKRFTALPDTLMGTVQPVTTAPQGNSLPHNNMQPYLVLNFVIALSGVFPSRN